MGRGGSCAWSETSHFLCLVLSESDLKIVPGRIGVGGGDLERTREDVLLFARGRDVRQEWGLVTTLNGDHPCCVL